MTFTFRPGVREQTPLLIGLAGPSGSGKTFSALRLATGLAGSGKVYGIDTESRRMLHYADQFRFEYGELGEPFQPAAYLGALKAAKEAGAAAIVVDSMSHEHEGPGGILEMHEKQLTEMAGSDWGKRERMKFTAWIKPKAEHNKFVNAVLQLGIHCVFCFRAKEKLALIKDDKGKIVPTPQGWQPICSDRFEYEMTALLMLPPNSQGVPDRAAKATKLQEQHKALIPDGERLSEQTGQRLAEWARGGQVQQPARPNNGSPAQALDLQPPAQQASASSAPASGDWQAKFEELRSIGLACKAPDDVSDFWDDHARDVGALEKEAPELHARLRSDVSGHYQALKDAAKKRRTGGTEARA